MSSGDVSHGGDDSSNHAGDDSSNHAGDDSSNHAGDDSSNHAGEEVTVKIYCMSDGSKFSVQVYLDSTVGFFKSIIAQKCEIPTYQQIVVYRARILEDDQTLQSYGLEADHTVYLVRSFATASTDAGVRGANSISTADGFNEDSIKISSGDVSHGGDDSSNHAGEEVTVKIRCTDGSEFSVQVYLDSTVEFFKSVLAQKCEIPSHQQILVYRGRVLKDDQTLQSYVLEADHIVYLVRISATASTDVGVRGANSILTADGSNEAGGMQTNLGTQSSPTGNVSTLSNELDSPPIQPKIVYLLELLLSIYDSNPAQFVTFMEIFLQLLRYMPPQVGSQTSLEPVQNAGATEESPEEFFAIELSQLREMGFTNTRENIRALIEAGGSLIRAVARLTENPGRY